ncbi:hypothetical protein [Cupriavidus necator]
MSSQLRFYVALLFSVVVAWMWLHISTIRALGHSQQAASLCGIAAVYLCSHLFRMLRLGLLSLDEREKMLPLMMAHGLTAFPSSFLPFKLGEILRLGAFVDVYERKRKALAVWLAERFGDVLVITGFILGLYLFRVSVPDSMRMIFVLFATISVIGLLGLFALTKILVYLNRHLVLTSHSSRGLLILRMSHALRSLEADIHRSIEGRISAFLLLSVAIWAIEIAALSLFVHHFSINKPEFSALFVSGLVASVAGNSAGGALAFGFYQSLTLVLVSLIALSIVCLANRLRKGNKT